MVDVNSQLIFDITGKKVYNELHRHNKQALIDATVNGLTIDATNLVLGNSNPDIVITSSKGLFKDNSAITVDFGTTGLTLASIDVVADSETATIKTTGTVQAGAVTVEVGPDSMQNGETLGVARVEALYNMPKEAEALAWAMAQMAATRIPATPTNLAAKVDGRRVDFTWECAEPNNGYKYFVIVEGTLVETETITTDDDEEEVVPIKKSYKLESTKFTGYLDHLGDGTYTAYIYSRNKDLYESDPSATITFIVDNVANATFTATTTLVEGSTAGDVVITIKDSEWIEKEIATGITVEGLTNPAISVSGETLTLSYTGLAGVVAGAKQITIAKETNKDGIEAEISVVVGNAPSVEVSGTVKQYAGGVLTLTLTGATFADDVTGITAPCGANVPVVAKTGDNTATLTYANADLANITITIPATAIKEAVALNTSYNVSETATITMSVTTTLTTGATEGTVVATLSEGNFKTGADVFTNWEVIGCNLDGQTPTITIEGGKATLTYTGINATGGTVFVQALDTITPNGTNLIATIGFDRVTVPTVQAVYENESPWEVGTAYNVELKMNAGDYGGENYTAQWTDFDAAEWTKVEMQNKSDSSWVDITALLTSSGGQLGQQLNVWTGSQYIRLTPAYVAEGDSTRTAKLVVTSVQGSWDPIEVDMSFNINNVAG